MSTPTRYCTMCGSPIEPGFRTCRHCGDPAAPAAPTTIETASMTVPRGPWNMPSVVWFLLGLLSATLVGGGAFSLFREPPPPGAAYDNLPQAEKEKILKAITEDLQEDPIKPPTDALPPPAMSTGDQRLIDRSP